MSHLKNIENKLIHGENLSNMQSGKIVFTNGCFDILHKGHVTYLSKAADLGDHLVVGLNSDASVKRLKGEGRPVKDEESRAFILASLECVSAVILFEEDTPLELIEKIRPDVLVKGGDYDPSCTDSNDPKYIVGSDFVRSYGGEVQTISFVDGHSSTKLIDKMK